MKRIVATIFLLIFSFQILPVKEIGRILFKGQITEEEVHTGDDGDASADSGFKMKKDCEFYHEYNDWNEHHALIAFHNYTLSIALIASDYLPEAFIPDIPTPPPNC